MAPLGTETTTLTLAQFVELHRPQLESNEVPQRYWEALFSKMSSEVGSNLMK